MANPDPTIVLKDGWRLVASGVTSGNIHKLKNTPSSYLQTYRIKDDPAPTDKEEGALMFELSNQEPIDASEEIDIYIWATGADGLIRVDV